MGTWWPFQSGNSYFFLILAMSIEFFLWQSPSLLCLFFSFWNPYYMDLLGYFSNFFHLFSPIYPPLCLFTLVPKRFLQVSSYATVVFIFAITFSISNSSFFSLNITFYTAFCSFLGVAVSFISLNIHWKFSSSLCLCLTDFLLPAPSVSSKLYFSAHLAFVWSFLLEPFLRCLVILGHLLLWGSGN